MSTVLRTSHCSKVFKRRNHTHTAVDDISFEIHAGESIALLGHNGAGKSTLIDMLLGLKTPTTGEISVLGGSPQQAAQRGWIGAMLQTGGLLGDLTVKTTLDIVASTYTRHYSMSALIEETGLTPILRKKIKSCSGGQIQCLRLALALLPDPQILFLDEPTAGMDPLAREEFWDSMKQRIDQGRTIIFSTHYIEEAQQFSQRLFFLSEGKLLVDAPTSEYDITDLYHSRPEKKEL